MVRTHHCKLQEPQEVVEEWGTQVLPEGRMAVTAHMFSVSTVLAGWDGRLAAPQAWELAQMVLLGRPGMAVPAEAILEAGAEPLFMGVVAAAAVSAT